MFQGILNSYSSSGCKKLGSKGIAADKNRRAAVDCTFEQLTNTELARRMNVSLPTVSRGANGKRQPSLDLEWRYNSQLKKWSK